MPNEMIAGIVAKDLDSMEQWGGLHRNIQCTIVSRSKLRSIERRETSNFSKGKYRYSSGYVGREGDE